MISKTTIGWIAAGLLVVVLVLMGASGTYVVEPGTRGVEVTLGKVSPAFKPEGFGFKLPLVTTIVPQVIRQQTATMKADCYSSDLQQVEIDVRILYRVPQSSVVAIFRDYEGDPFEALIKPRVAEALNEITASRTAELIVQKREDVKSLALESARHKLGDILMIEDLVLEAINLTTALEAAIESKMVQEQEAARSRFAQQQAQIEANSRAQRAADSADRASELAQQAEREARAAREDADQSRRLLAIYIDYSRRMRAIMLENGLTPPPEPDLNLEPEQ